MTFDTEVYTKCNIENRVTPVYPLCNRGVTEATLRDFSDFFFWIFFHFFVPFAHFLLFKSVLMSKPTLSDSCRDLTGFELTECQVMAGLLELDQRDIIVALLFLHGNCTALHVSYLARFVFGYQLQGDACNQILLKVARSASKLPHEYRPESRFMYTEDEFPNCFSIVDGVPVYCRANADYYNDKNGAKSVVFQVVTNLAGAPIAWSGGVEGSRTDAYAFDGWNAFRHEKAEFILADSMYSASAHCVTTWKSNYKDASFSDEQKLVYEMRFRKVRARVEHFFARLHRHSWISGARQDTGNIGILFNLLMQMEARREYGRAMGTHYTCKMSLTNRVVRDEDVCTCGFVALDDIPMPQRSTTRKRKSLAATIVPLGRPINKGSSRARKGRGVYYVALTKEEKIAKFKLYRLSRKADKLDAKKKKDALRKEKHQRGEAF